MSHIPEFPASHDDEWFHDLHGGHELVVRPWYAADLVTETSITVDCDTCSMELAHFDHEAPRGVIR